MAKPYDPKDFYYRKAKKQGLRARSAFKIEEILRRHRLLGHGDAVLDLGAAPGGFLQILAETVGPHGVAVGVDLEPIRNLGKPWVRTAVVDLLAADAVEQIRALHAGPYRLVTSDMAPKTIGIKVSDEARSLELVRMALETAEALLARGGAFVAKVFMGGDFPVLKKELQARFGELHVVRPEATREHSFEVYVVGKAFRGGARSAGPSRADAAPDAASQDRPAPQAAPPQLELPLPGLLPAPPPVAAPPAVAQVARRAKVRRAAAAPPVRKAAARKPAPRPRARVVGKAKQLGKPKPKVATRAKPRTAVAPARAVRKREARARRR